VGGKEEAGGTEMAGNMRVLSLPVIAVEAPRCHGDLSGDGSQAVGYEIGGPHGCPHPPRDIGLVGPCAPPPYRASFFSSLPALGRAG